MSADIPQTVLEAADITAITQLIVRERESRDLCMWERMLDCFHADSQVRISWFTGTGPEFVEASRGMVARGMLAKHRLGPVHVTLNGDRAVASLSAIIDIPSVIDGVELILSAHGLFLFTVERREGSWRIHGFDGIYRRDEFTPAILGQTVTLAQDIFARFRPSYRNLSYSLYLAGYEPNNDLPGEDRPETVQRLFEELFGWAGLPVPT